MKALNIHQLRVAHGGTTFVASFQVPGLPAGAPGSLTPPVVYTVPTDDLWGTLMGIAVISLEAQKLEEKFPSLQGLRPQMVTNPLH